MKKLAIIGGLGPESTSVYYNEIIKKFRESYKVTGFPEITIESLNLKYFLSLAQNNKWNKIAEILVEKFNQLELAGAKIGAIASNTPHKVFNDVQKNTSLNLISIVEATKNYVSHKKLDKLLLLGTKFTMQSDFYSNEFRKNEIDLVTPSESDQNYIQDKLFSEIELGIITESTKNKFIDITTSTQTKNNAQGVILACTELPLILKPGDFTGEYIDPTKIHIKAIAEAIKIT